MESPLILTHESVVNLTRLIHDHLCQRTAMLTASLWLICGMHTAAIADDFKPKLSYSAAEMVKLHGALGKRGQVAGGDLHGNIPADRVLKSHDVRIILALSVVAIHKRYEENDRNEAILHIGMLGHVFGVPPLLAVLRDSSETDDLRTSAVYGLSQIADKRSVDHLVDMLEDNSLSNDLANAISEQLLKMTRRSDRSIRLKKCSNAESAVEWKKWWKKNRKRAKLVRATTS